MADRIEYAIRDRHGNYVGRSRVCSTAWGMDPLQNARRWRTFRAAEAALRSVRLADWRVNYGARVVRVRVQVTVVDC